MMLTSPTPAPYRGLVPYTEKDAALFFGRAAETEIIIANLMASRLTLLYGASGVGKSSVLRAGAVHTLRETAHTNLIERGSPEYAVIVFSDWRDDPVAGLIQAVRQTVAKTWEDRPNDPISDSLDLVETMRAGAKSVGGELFIILDQFEEYFLYHSQESGKNTFAAEFPRAVNRNDLNVSFLISIREDAVAKLDRFKGQVPNIFDNYFRIEHLDRDAARDAILKPLDEYNRGRDNNQVVSIEPALVDAVLGQVKAGQVFLGEIGRGTPTAPTSNQRIETPYLQLVMTRLWDEERRARFNTLRLATLRRLGGAGQIVRTHLDAAMSALSSGDREVAARVFRFLVTPSGTKIAHTAPDLASYAGMSIQRIMPCLNKLSSSDVRILRPVAPPTDQPQVARFEIFHDVLAAAILDWRARYARSQQRGTVLRIGSALGAVLIIVILVLGVYAIYTNIQLDQKSRTVQQQAESLSMSNQKIDSQATAVSQQAALAQQNATAVSQLQVAVQTLAPDTPSLIAITATPTPRGGTAVRTSTPDIAATATLAARATTDAYARATAVFQATKAVQGITQVAPPSATPRCNSVTGVFATTYRLVGNALGCPSANPISGYIAEENFQKGKMFWREPVDAGQVVALYNDSTWQILKAGDFLATDPEYSCPDAKTPSTSPPTPKRGFGKAWCKIPGVRDRLGNATDAEWGYTNWMQQFDLGFTLRVESGDVFVFYNSNQRWERLVAAK